MKGIKCSCGKIAKPKKDLKINGHKIDGWKCSCGESYLDPIQTQRMLLINQLKKQKLKAKLGRIKSNLILRVPKSIERALNLKQGEEVTLKVEKDSIKILTNS